MIPSSLPQPSVFELDAVELENQLAQHDSYSELRESIIKEVNCAANEPADELILIRFLSRLLNLAKTPKAPDRTKFLLHILVRKELPPWPTLSVLMEAVRSDKLFILGFELLDQFFFTGCRLTSAISDFLAMRSAPAPLCVEGSGQLCRDLVNLHTFALEHRPRASEALRICDRRLFVSRIVSSCAELKKPGKDVFIGHLIGHFGLNFIDEFWPEFLKSSINVSCFCHVPDKFRENALLRVLLHCTNHDKLVTLLEQFWLNGESTFLLLLHRLLFVRLVRDGMAARRLFRALTTLASLHASVRGSVDERLGLNGLRMWADPVSLQRNNAEQRLCICQFVASWLVEFRLPLKIPLDDMLEILLNGISNHLASSRHEIRQLGLLLGQFLMCHVQCSEEPLDFDVKPSDNVYTEKLVPHFTRLDEGTVVDQAPESDPTQETGCEAPIKPVLDSDDDSDKEMDFVKEPLRSEPAADKGRTVGEKTGWPPTSKRPRYVKECLDALSLTGPEDSETFNTCLAYAERLFYEHPSSVREFDCEIARTLLHLNPCPSPFEEQVTTSRHKALVATTCISPERVAKYLTGEFANAQLAFNAKCDVLHILTESACLLAESKAGREGRNLFAPMAAHFFFPLLDHAPKLIPQPGAAVNHFQYQTDIILGKLVATLATIYACARHSPALTRMGRELLPLAARLSRDHPEALVRRAALTAAGTVLSLSSLTERQEELSDAVSEASETLSLISLRDNDSDCRALATRALSACSTD